MSDMVFEQMLAAHNQNFKDASEFSDWMPPDGKYVVTVLKCDQGVKEESGKSPFGWWKLTARVETPQDEKLNGREFSLGFYNTNALGILKGQARVLNGGEPVNSLVDADLIFRGAVGMILGVETLTTVSKKNGQEYTNCYVREIIVTEEQITGLDSTPPQG